MSGGKTISNSESKIEALQLQSSAYGVTIPVVAGVTRIAGNLIDYEGFKAVATTTTQGGKGGGVKVQNTTYTYYASVLMGLAHGQITDVPRIWVGKKLYQASGASASYAQETDNYSVPAGGGTFTITSPSQFGSNVSVVAFSIPEMGPEVVLAEGTDYTVSSGAYTFPSGSIACGYNVSVTYTRLVTQAGQTASQQLGVTLFTGPAQQSPPSWLTSNYPSRAINYPNLAYISAYNYQLGTGAQVDNHLFEVVGPSAYSLGSSIPDVDPSSFTASVLQNTRYGARLPAAFVPAPTQWSTYCIACNLLMSPALDTQLSAADFLKQITNLTNTAVVWSDNQLKFIPYGDTTVTGNGATFTPNVTPVYDLTDDAYVPDPGKPPVKVTRKAGADCYNHFRIQFQNRSNDYAPEIAEAKDQADIEANGLRSANVIDARTFVCDPQVARNIAQLLLQRSVYVRRTFEFSLPWAFAFLEPMDLVTLTDSSLNLSKTAVRITQIEESGGKLNFTAEDFALGVAHAATYNTQVSAGYLHNYNVSPGSVNAPVLFEAPAALTSSGLEVWAAVSGSGQYWGGCSVWVSMDGTNYTKVTTIYGGSRYGQFTSGVSGGVAPVQLVNGQLLSASTADANALSTLCYAGGASQEYFAYASATLTGTNQYNLGGLVRGAYGTAGGATHSAGDPFVRCDDSIAKSGPLDLSMIGKTIYFKFTSFNIFGGAEEVISAVSAYTYTVTGSMYKVSTDGAQSFYQETDPSTQQAIGIGTIWVQPSTGIMKRWNGTSWDAYSALGTADVTLVNGGGCTVAGNVITKTATNAWGNGGAYSQEGYTGGAYAQAMAPANGTDISFGLNTDPTTDNNWTSLDYAIYCAASGNGLYAHESGVQSAQIGTWAPGDVLTVAYDGSSVKYMQNGTVIRSVTVSSGKKFYFDSALYQQGATLKGIRFGPMTSNDWSSVGNRPKQFRVISAGYSSTSTPSPGAGLWNGETGANYYGASRSYNLALIQRSTGAVTFFDYYDIYGGGAAVAGTLHGNSLAYTLNNTSSDYIAVVWTYDEPNANHYDSTLQAAMKRCGASAGVFGSPQWQGRAAYLLIGICGCGEGNGFEAYQGSINSDPNAWCDASFIVTAQGQLIVSGTGATPRTLADYSYTGDLNATYGATFGTNVYGQAQTSNIAPNAATLVLKDYIANQTQSLTNSGLGVKQVTVNNTINYTNNTGGTVDVELSWSAIHTFSVSAGTPTGTLSASGMVAQWTVNGVAASYTESNGIDAVSLPNGSSKTWRVSTVYHLTLAAGDVLAANTVVLVQGTASVNFTLQTQNAMLRATIVKR
jgi:hypothetical protein